MIKIPFDHKKLFPYILGLSALFVAGIAAFFSVMGIGMLFSGAVISASLMALSLEVGKISATTFLYRYWKKTTTFLKVYLCAAILVLMVITSLGVFGWLSSAYQHSALQYDINQQQISVMVEQKTQLQSQVVISKERVDDLLANRRAQEKRSTDALDSEALLRNPTALRQIQLQNGQLIQDTDREINNEKTRYTDYLNLVFDLDKKIADEKLGTLKSKDVITFKFVAEAIGVDLTKTVKWFIVAIISVFDPLAVSLILAYNVAIFNESTDEPKEVEVEAEPEVIEDEKKKVVDPIVVDFSTPPQSPTPTITPTATQTPTPEPPKNPVMKPTPYMHPSEIFSRPMR